MSKGIFRQSGLRNESLAAVIISAAVALIFFYFLHMAGDALLTRHFADEDVWKGKMSDKARELQQYITENHISSRDVKKMNQWMQSQKGLFVYISNVGKKELIYDSEDYQGKQISNNRSRPHYSLEFSDRRADLQLHWDYADRYFSIALAIEIVATIALFLLLFLTFVYRKIRDIAMLEEAVGILESGDLEHRVTMQGSDEIASLAHAIDDMRLALKENMDRSDELLAANKELVTSMAHDLRTPLTTLLLYLDLLDKGKYRDMSQMRKFIAVAREKGERIRHMSDDLFRQFLATGEPPRRLDEAQSIRAAFEEVLSNFLAALSEQGFRQEVDVDLRTDRYVRVSADYLNRILDNISSNVQKYAAPEKGLRVWTEYTDDTFRLGFANDKALSAGTQDSTRIGVKNIEKMMERMGGRCEVENSEEYSIILGFPLEIK